MSKLSAEQADEFFKTLPRLDDDIHDRIRTLLMTDSGEEGVTLTIASLVAIHLQNQRNIYWELNALNEHMRNK